MMNQQYNEKYDSENQNVGMISKLSIVKVSKCRRGSMLNSKTLR